MISQLSIKNFKSIQELEIELGRVTVLIGANGSGKSNILESVALCSAAASNKLDHEFLASRGIRVPDDPRFMRSAFEAKYVADGISISIAERQDHDIEGEKVKQEQKRYRCILQNKDSSPYSIWSDIYNNRINRSEAFIEALQNQLEGQSKRKFNVEEVRAISHELDKIAQGKLIPPSLKGFQIYSPENTSLRTFETEGQIQPLGIKGEGLFKLLTVLSNQRSKERLDEIKKRLTLLDWFDDFEIVPGLSTGERSINIKDRYLDENLSYFTQKSANEGFLFLLFYFTLFISRETPSFFAIDNIDASLNPKLCSQLLKELTELAKTHDKQAIVTTHNPAVLDGLDLNDDQQRLFVVSRNKLGHTKVKRVTKQASLPDQKPIRLSEAFLRGYLGGLPGNF